MTVNISLKQDSRQHGWASCEQDTINDVVRRGARNYGNRPFLDVLGDLYSYADIQRESCRLANGLAEL